MLGPNYLGTQSDRDANDLDFFFQSDQLSTSCVLEGFTAQKTCWNNQKFFSKMIGPSLRSNVCAQRSKTLGCAKPYCADGLSFTFHCLPHSHWEKKWWKCTSLLALSVQCRRSLWHIEKNVVGVAEFNSSGRRIGRSVWGRREGDAEMCAEPRNSCGQSGRGIRQSCRIFQ